MYVSACRVLTAICHSIHNKLNMQALDYLAIGVHELANISERRIDRLTNPGELMYITSACMCPLT